MLKSHKDYFIALVTDDIDAMTELLQETPISELKLLAVKLHETVNVLVRFIVEREDLT